MDSQINTEDLADVPTADELSVLKNRARLMGISFSPNIGLQALKQKIDAKMNDEPQPVEDAVNPLAAAGEADEEPPVAETAMQIRARLRRDELKLVRLRITNLDPKKKDLPGEIISVSNEYIGNVRKFIPFGEQSDEGYHVPHCLYNLLKERQFLDIRTVKGQNGTPVVKHKWVREFALEVLPPLTQPEIDRLATAQAAAGVFNSDD